MKPSRIITAALLAAACLSVLPTSVFAQRRAVYVPRGPAVVVRGGYRGGYPGYVYGARYPCCSYGGWGIYGSWGIYGGWGVAGAYGYPYASGYPYAYGYSYGYGYPYGSAYPYSYGYPYSGYASSEASIRVQVTPKTAEVFLDGYFAGTVDEFDGSFQRLRAEPGQHEVAVFAEGYRTFSQRLYLQPASTLNLRRTLDPLQPGDVQEPRPSANGSVQPARRSNGQAPRRPVRTPPVGDIQQGPPPQEAPSRDNASFGVLSVRVQPGGADVLIDGERWNGPDGAERLLIQLAPGPHRIEIRRDGYRGFSQTIDVRPGQTETMNVGLTKE